MEGWPVQKTSYNDDELAWALAALSHPVRLAIVRALEEPRCLSEIGITPAPMGGRTGVVRGEVLARQTVKQHLERLTSAGIVVAQSTPKKNGAGTEYVLNPQALAVIAQAFHELAAFFAKPTMTRAVSMDAAVAVS
jgi:DNA-binding transcriptional ArsR family regulator